MSHRRLLSRSFSSGIRARIASGIATALAPAIVAGLIAAPASAAPRVPASSAPGVPAALAQGSSASMLPAPTDAYQLICSAQREYADNPHLYNGVAAGSLGIALLALATPALSSTPEGHATPLVPTTLLSDLLASHINTHTSTLTPGAPVNVQFPAIQGYKVTAIDNLPDGVEFSGNTLTGTSPGGSYPVVIHISNGEKHFSVNISLSFGA